MLFKSVVTAALAAAVVAQPLQHQHHQHEKRAIITEVRYVTKDAEDAPAAAAATPAAAAPAAAAHAVVQKAAVSPAPVSSATKSTATQGSSSASSASVPSSSDSFSGPAKGITYSPYANDGSCKSADQVKREVQALSQFEIIRLYGVDCNQVPNVLAGMTASQKLFAGIFDVHQISQGVATLAAAVKSVGWDKVYTVSIGNELVNAGQANPDQIKSYVDQGRAALKSAGYNGPVVSVDTFIAVYNNKALCDHSDYVAANAHAYFDGNVAAENAGDWVAQQHQGLLNTCPGKKVLIVESGWPSAGNTHGKAVAGKSQQKAAISDISKKAGEHVFLFNAYNDGWKQPGAWNCEQFWGVFSN